MHVHERILHMIVDPLSNFVIFDSICQLLFKPEKPPDFTEKSPEVSPKK